MARKSSSDIYRFDSDCIYKPFWGRYSNRRGINEMQNTNFVGHCLIYTLETEINLLEFNPAYPKEPKSVREKIRKARMDKGLLIREPASQLEVTEDTVINWEIRNVKPADKSIKKLKALLED